MTRDEQLMFERVKRRDPAAIREVVEELMPQVLRMAIAAGLRREHAEDVAQATFLTFLESLDRFEGRSTIRTWVFGILFRKLSETRRDLRKDARFEDVDDVDESRFDARGRWVRPPRATDEGVFAAELHRSLDACLELLAERQRVVFELRERDGMSTEEICNVLGCSRTNLGVMLHRARAALRSCLEARGLGRQDEC